MIVYYYPTPLLLFPPPPRCLVGWVSMYQILDFFYVFILFLQYGSYVEVHIVFELLYCTSKILIFTFFKCAKNAQIHAKKGQIGKQRYQINF